MHGNMLQVVRVSSPCQTQRRVFVWTPPPTESGEVLGWFVRHDHGAGLHGLHPVPRLERHDAGAGPAPRSACRKGVFSFSGNRRGGLRCFSWLCFLLFWACFKKDLPQEIYETFRVPPPKIGPHNPTLTRYEVTRALMDPAPVPVCWVLFVKTIFVADRQKLGRISANLFKRGDPFGLLAQP